MFYNISTLLSNAPVAQSLLKIASGPHPKIAMFHASWGPGHNSTDYERYYATPPGADTLYKVEHYQSAYEPYVIVSRRVSWCVPHSGRDAGRSVR